MKWRNKVPFSNTRSEPEQKSNRLQIKAIERELEEQLKLAHKRQWDYKQFVHTVLEMLIVMRERDKLRRRK